MYEVGGDELSSSCCSGSISSLWRSSRVLSESGSDCSPDNDRDAELAEGECRVLGSTFLIGSSESWADLCCDFMVFVIRSSLKGLLRCGSLGG